MRKKYVKLNGEETSFVIYEDGKLYREDTKRWYAPQEYGSYLSYMLRWKGKTYHRRIHRLVAEAFIPNPENKPYVHHIDGDRVNNLVSNLEWATAAENNVDKAPRVSQPRHINKKINYEKERWKQYKDTQFYVSNMGRVKNILTKNILKGNIRENGYLRYGLRYNGKVYSFNGHNLVWEVWNGPQKYVLNHINGDKCDNRLENLEDIPQSENLLKSINRDHWHITGQYDDDGNLINTYRSQREAARAFGHNDSSQISRAIANGWRAYGFYWRRIED